MSRNYELWQRASGPVPGPVTVPATVVPSDLGRPTRPIQAENESEETQPEASELARTIEIFRKHWRWSLLFAMVVAGSVAAVTVMMRPVYEPSAVLEVDPRGSEVLSMQDRSGGAAGDLGTQVQNLQGEGLALDVIRALRLDQNPDFGGQVKPAGAAAIQTSDIAVQLTPAEDQALIVFNGSRKVTPDPAGRLITVSVAAHDPVLAAQITNTLANRFIERDVERRKDDVAQWQLQLEDIKQRTDDSNRALASFQSSSGFSAIGDNQNTFSERVIELSKQLMQAQADRIQMQAYLDKLNSVQPTSLPQVSSNPVVQQLTTKLG